MRLRSVIRTICATGAVGTVCLLIHAAASSALPAKEYRVQESTRCMDWQGCPRMLRNALNHARQFCQSEGGVLKGDKNSDFRCAQRGVYCVVTGRIECQGRFDPTKGATPQGDSGSPQAPRTKTCLDVGCKRYVSHAPGSEERGTHACPLGYGVAGVSGAGNNLVCQSLHATVRATRVESKNRRQGLLACPKGMVVRGVNEDRTTLLCAQVDAVVTGEVLQDDQDPFGLQVCVGDDGAYAAERFVTGVDVDRKQLLCAAVEPR